MEFDQAVDGLGGAVGCAAGVEVGQQRVAPLFQGAAQPRELGGRAGRQHLDQRLGCSRADGWRVGMLDGPDALRCLPGDEHLFMGWVGVDGRGEAVFPLVVKVLGSGPEDRLDAEQRVTLAAPVSEGSLLGSASDLVNGQGGELHDMEGVQHGRGIVEVVVKGVLVAPKRVQGGYLNLLQPVVAAFLDPGGIGDSRASRDQVQQPGSGCAICGGCEVDHAGEHLWPTTSWVLVMPDVLIDPQVQDPCETGLVSIGGLKDRLDRAPDGLPVNPELARQSQHRGVLVTQLSHDPPGGAASQHRAGAASAGACSVKVPLPHKGSAQRHVRVRHTIIIVVSPKGISCRTRLRRP